jgi:hypothetical protein
VWNNCKCHRRLFWQLFKNIIFLFGHVIAYHLSKSNLSFMFRCHQAFNRAKHGNLSTIGAEPVNQHSRMQQTAFFCEVQYYADYYQKPFQDRHPYKKGAFSRLFRISSTVITITTIRNIIAKAALSVSSIHIAFNYSLFCSYHPQDDCWLLCHTLLWAIKPIWG